MTSSRFHQISSRYSQLKIAVVGDFCLDRYFEIDPARAEISIETGLPVHNIVNVRCQPGGAGTIVNNLAALGLGAIYPVGIAGTDGEGYELRKALTSRYHVSLEYFHTIPDRNTFTYTKPLICSPGETPLELSRLDLKNWYPTPEGLQRKIASSLLQIAPSVDAIILLDQVDIPDTGVITPLVLEAVATLASRNPDLLILADSRRSLRGYPEVGFKMNNAELGRFLDQPAPASLEQTLKAVEQLTTTHRKPVFVTLAGEGIVGWGSGAGVHHQPALPLRGQIDVVGAGDSVMANLAAALAGGATTQEALCMAVIASSIVIHQLGTTGTATTEEMQHLGQAAGLIS